MLIHQCFAKDDFGNKRFVNRKTRIKNGLVKHKPVAPAYSPTKSYSAVRLSF